MTADTFNCLKQMSQLVQEQAAPVPASEELPLNWHGAAFDLMGTRCVISADDTRMIVDLGDTIPLPGVKHWVKGLANVGGRVIAITDLAAFVSGGNNKCQGSQALIVTGRGVHAGLLIEQSYGGVRLSTEELRADRPVADELRPYVAGVFTTSHGDYTLLDTKKLLTDADFTQASAITPN
jgi:twitching motility protein PilI